MEPIPLPAYVHYELLLQFIEQKTRFAVQRNSPQYEKIDQLIITLRKAVALHKQLEQSCVQANLPVDYCWSLNQVNPELINFPEG
jgi:Family of unknown function (DUF5340)